MRRMLVTGAAGFIGSNFVRYWANRHPEDTIVIVDVLTYAGNMANINDLLSASCLFFKADINDTEFMQSLLREHALDTIVHFAAESHVDRSIETPDAFIEANVLGTHSLLKAARKVWQIDQQAPDFHRFHHVSTDEVYGSLGLDDPAFTEQHPYAPNSPYSASKASSDFLVRAYHHTYGMSVTTSNCSNNYGPYHYPEKLIPLTIINVLHGKSIPVYGNGKNIRDWLHVDDHARGIEKILHAGVPGKTYNIGGVNEWSNIDIVTLVCTTVDEAFRESHSLAARFPDCPAAAGEACNSLISFVGDRVGHDFRYAIDTSLIKAELAYEPAIAFEKGIKSTVNWFIENSAWWESVPSRSCHD